MWYIRGFEDTDIHFDGFVRAFFPLNGYGAPERIVCFGWISKEGSFLWKTSRGVAWRFLGCF